MFSSGDMPCRINLNLGTSMKFTIEFDRDRASQYDLDIRKAIPGYEAVLVSVPLRLTSNGAFAPASRRDFAPIGAVGLTAYMP